ncbi:MULTISPECIES: ABC transporter permease [unclassified Crossiella]|uniref:ABC transporter permease n=1 Tax=unclassified Crossiella TaxID=2620835 RepID=UPI001FFF0402|nr:MULTISPECIES: ABC transporter permease [unclassified Crossiella]MCK2238437.1 ABC transporter permease [Crossiella sp. S99.2]MCK2251993.1 ABC transporter permease [Crossiella sp. S99.1]
MTTLIRSFGRNDLRAIRGDTVLVTVLLAPVLYAVSLWAVPAVTRFAAATWDFDLTPYHPLLVSAFGVLGPAMVLGSLCGLLLLDDKDQRTLLALQVTPAPRAAYPAYRAGATILLVTIAVEATLALSGLVTGAALAKGLAIGVLTGLLSVLIGLTMGTLAGNKVEGIAILKGLGMLVSAIPLIPFFFLDSPWQLAFGLLPSYWPARALWAAMDGGVFWPYLLGGLVYNSLLAVVLLRWTARRG